MRRNAIGKSNQVSSISGPNRNKKSETRVSNIEWKSTLEDIGLQRYVYSLIQTAETRLTYRKNIRAVLHLTLNK